MEREPAALKELLVGGRDRRDEFMREVRGLTRKKAALVAQVETEDRRHAEFVRIDDVILIMRTTWQIVQRTVRDPKALEAIEAGLRTVLEKADDDRMKGKMKGGHNRARS